MKQFFAIFGLSLAVCLLIIHPLNASLRPRIAVVATGGTIAGTASTATQAAYSPAQLGVNTLLESVPEVAQKADITPIQFSNIASQYATANFQRSLALLLDSLLSVAGYHGAVVLHGTDTMEETAYFLQLTLASPRPIVLTGAMRPASSLSADGPMNLYNAICLAASPEFLEPSSSKCGPGVMLVMNDYIYSADDLTKVHSVNPNAFACPNLGPMGFMRDGCAFITRNPTGEHGSNAPFPIRSLPVELPKVDIVYAYAGAGASAVNAFINDGAQGIVCAGLGHGNASLEMEKALAEASAKGIAVVRGTRILQGGVDVNVENPWPGMICSYLLNPQKARILLMLALTRSKNPEILQKYYSSSSSSTTQTSM